MHILILDDDIELAETLRDLLVLDGHDVETVTTVDAARQALAGARRFDVAVFDLNLKGENTINLLRDLKKTAPTMRVLAMTGGGKVEADIGLPLATAHGADGVLLKPFSNDEFLKAVTSKN